MDPELLLSYRRAERLDPSEETNVNSPSTPETRTTPPRPPWRRHDRSIISSSRSIHRSKLLPCVGLTGWMQQNPRADPDQRSGKRKSSGKRKLSDQGEPSQPHSQRTISELLSSHPSRNNLHQNPSPPSKRSRLSVSPSRSASTHSASPNKMYNFSGSPPKNGTAFVRSMAGPNANAPSVKAQPFGANARQNNFSPHAGAKKLVVKNLRTGPRMNQEPYFDKTWAQLDAALSAIFDGQKPESSLEELYKGAENICRQERAALLAKKVQERCKDYVAGKLRDNLVTRAGGGTDVDTLRAVIEAWSVWHSRLVRHS